MERITVRHRKLQSTSLNSAKEGHVSLPSHPIISLKIQAFWNRKITAVFTVKKAFASLEERSLGKTGDTIM